MKQHMPLLLFTIAIVCLAMMQPLQAVEESAAIQDSQGTVSENHIESKLAELETDPGLDEPAAKKLKQLYQKTLNNLQAAASNEKAASAFQQLAKNAPAVMKRLHREAEKFNAAPVSDSLNRKQSGGQQDTGQLLQQEKEALAVMDAKLVAVELSLEKEKARPPLIKQLTLEARKKQDEISGELKQPQSSEEGLAISQAKHWLLESRLQLINTEIKRLTQELLTQSVRLDLLEAERDWAVAGMKWSSARIMMLEDQLTRKHQEEVSEVSRLAETSLRDTEGKHSRFVKIARQNAVLSNEIVSMANRLDQLTLHTDQADMRARQIKEDYISAREIIDIGGLSKGMGYMLLRQHYALPDPNSLHRQANERKALAAEVGVNRLLHRQEQKKLRDVDAYVDRIMTEEDEQQPLLRDELKELLKVRLVLLEKALESDDFYLQKLGGLESAQQRLLDAINDYTSYLSVHMLWVRSASRAELQALGVLPEQAWRILSPDGWYEVFQVLVYQVTHSPVFIFLVLLIVALFWYRKPAIAAILTGGSMLGRPETDRFIYTIKSLLFTLIAVIALPLAVAVTGWQLKDSSQSTVFSIAVGSALLMFAIQFFYIRVMRMMCMPGGLADAHFGWPESSLVLLRRELNRLSWIYLPAALVSFITFYLDPLNAGWEVGQTAFLIMVGSLCFAFFHLLHPVRGVFAGRRGDSQAKLPGICNGHCIY